MQWIGLTGGIGSGKSTVAKILQTLGEAVVDADALSKQVIEVGEIGYQKVLQNFGNSILAENKSIDRAKLAKIVFSSPEKLLSLEQIIHPEVQQKVLQEKLRFSKMGLSRCFYDVPLLFEKHLEAQFNSIVLVYSKLDVRIRRIQLRNQWSLQEIENRISAQISLEEKVKMSTYVINNNSGLIDLEEEVKKLVIYLDKLSIPS